jgi:hypothetical protein
MYFFTGYADAPLTMSLPSPNSGTPIPQLHFLMGFILADK